MVYSGMRKQGGTLVLPQPCEGNHVMYYLYTFVVVKCIQDVHVLVNFG